jgi:hypothetical protein
MVGNVSIYIGKDDSFSQTSPVARECPHCATFAQLIPVSTPRYRTIATDHRPRRVALGFRCAACNAPRFARSQVRSITPERIELSSNLVEIERVRPRFQYAYLPEPVRELFSEALACYAADYHNAFASLCRRTVIASERSMPGSRSGLWRRAFEEIVRLGAIDAPTTTMLESILFGADHEMPMLDEDQSAILIEVMKDILYQCHVREAKFRSAMKMRRFFADEARSRVASLQSRRNKKESA